MTMAPSTAPVAVADVPNLDFGSSEPLDFSFPTVEEYLRETGDRTDVERKGSRGTPGEPYLVGASITTTYVKDLHELLQRPNSRRRRLSAEFDVNSTVSSNGILGFGVKLLLKDAIEGSVVEEVVLDGCFPSKRQAKEAAACKAIEYIKALPLIAGTDVRDTPGQVLEEDLCESENWVAQLYEYCTSRSAKPLYNFYKLEPATGLGFSCDVRVVQESGSENLEDKVFGDRLRTFRTKRSAKIAASKAAMEYFRTLPTTPNQVSGNVQEAIVLTPTAPKPKKGASQVLPPGSKIEVPVGAKATQYVNDICAKLDFPIPEYNFVQDPHAPGMFDVEAVIKRKNGLKPVKLTMRNIYGKKKAKETIARSILTWLVKKGEELQIEIVLN